MPETHYRSCCLCEATCGVAIEIEGDRVIAVRGDDADPFSKGYICPKATGLADLHHDPDRLTRPMVRDLATGAWREVEWDAAFDLVAERLRAVQRDHGRDAVAVYQGNPTAHNLGLLTLGQLFLRGLGTRSMFSATSVDQLPHMLAALTMYGNQLLMSVPDIDRCDYFLILGGNPAVSNGSLMTAPDVKARLKAIRARGGQVVVVDPRRTETAELADRHVFIRPGSDALLLLAMIHVLFAEGLVRLGRLAPHVSGVEALRTAAADLSPEATAAATGVAPDEVRRLARELAGAPRAVCYGRIGVCTQEFGGLAAWLAYAINALTGHLDEPGGMMFTTPAVDVLPLAARIGFDGGFARWRSRVSGYPEFGGELPVAALAEEIATPGPGQIRALITSAGNPVLSTPDGRRLEQALPGLDFMVSIDPYLNETTRHAHVILPPTSPLERSHYDLALNAFAVRNIARYSPPVFERSAAQRHDWEICVELMTRLQRGPRPATAKPERPYQWLRGPASWTGRAVGRLASRALRAVGPEGVLELGLRLGPHGLRKGRRGLSLRALRREPHGVDLGPLEPRLPARLGTADKKIELAPAIYLADLPRLRARLAADRVRPDGALILIGRRHLRSNNSWMHNSARLVKGKPRCTLIIHPADATARGLVDGARARLATRIGAIEVPVEVSDEIMPGVVSLPHGWGHDRPGTRLGVASAHAGASVNDITDAAFVDALSGTGALSGISVEVAAIAAGA
jgi:anaerobic selenocysteine-containing dehydrogenase